MRALSDRLTPRQWWGGLLAVVGAGSTVLLALLGNQEEPPAASTQALIALLSILAQLGAAWIFSGYGKADPTLAQRSVGRLVKSAQNVNNAKLIAEALQQRGTTTTELRQGVGELSVHLSYIEEGYVEAIEDWRVFHPRAVERAERNRSGDE